MKSNPSYFELKDVEVFEVKRRIKTSPKSSWLVDSFVPFSSEFIVKIFAFLSDFILIEDL